MGCGKTTLGKKLANKLAYAFVDLDHEIETKINMTIAEYFAKNGENAFRKLERDILQGFEYQENTVVSTGGGMPCFFDNLAWMNKNGTTVYIKMDAKALSKRLEGGKDQRPLLKDLDETGMIHFIETKLAEREPFYNQAKIIVNGVNLSAEKLINDLSL